MSSHQPVLERGAPTVPMPHQGLALKAAAVVGVGGFAVAAVVTGVATPGYDSRREAISGLAALDSQHAWIMILGFMFSAVGLLSAGLVLWKHVPTRAARVGSGLVVISAALMGVAGLARQDCSDQLATCKDFGEAVNASESYWVHQQASLLGFLLLVISFFLLARGLRRTARPGLAIVSRVVGVACVAGTALLVVTPPFVVDSYGFVQRLFVALLFGWPVVAALLASRRVTPTEGSASHAFPVVCPESTRASQCRLPSSGMCDAATQAIADR